MLSPSFVFAEAKFTWEPYLRFRHEFWKNIFDIENSTIDNRNFLRVKTSLGAKAELDENNTVYIKMTNENRTYFYWGTNSTGEKSTTYKLHEFFIDNLYWDVKNVFDLPVDLRLGRQDLPSSQYGEGFLLADGTPQDGTRTFYFNAVKALWHVADKNTLELMFIQNNKTDDMLPIINKLKGEQATTYSDETAYVLYHKIDPTDVLHLENYYIHKNEADGRPGAWTKGGEVHTVGTYAKYLFDPWTWRGQALYQAGSYGDNARQAWAGYTYLDRDFKGLPLSPKTSVGYYYTSGDDPSTLTNEGFNQLFSTYSWMSDFYSLSYGNETGTSYWTNLQMWRGSVTLQLTEKAKASFLYNYLRANEPQPGVHASFGTGKTRGHIPMLRVDYAFTKDITSYFLAEYFIPGDFYVDTADEGMFARTQIEVKF
jgi:hypothetical protein